MNYFAWSMWVKGKKRMGGCLHARDMNDAARLAARTAKLTVTRQDPNLPLRFRTESGEKASLLVFVPPELIKSDLVCEPNEEPSGSREAQNGR